jgi:DNA polymerase I-like protein with 3'-5' exonuclease and polymerase domains
MSMAVRAAEGNPLDQGSGKYRIIETRDEAIRWIRQRQGKRTIALDIEGDGDPDTVHPSRHDILCLGLCDGFETVILPEGLFDGILWPELADALEQCTTVAHNGKFDAGVLGFRLRGKNRPLRITHDTMLAHYALWPAGGEDGEHGDETSVARAYHGLKLLGDLYLACGNWSLARAEYQNMRSVDLKRLYQYNAWDVQRTYLLLQIFRDQFHHRPDQMRAYWNVLMPASHHLGWMEGRGVVVDVPYVRSDLVPEMTEQVLQLTKNLIGQANLILPGHAWPLVAKAKRMPGEDVKEARRFNPGSADQVRTILESQGVVLPVDRKAKTSKGSTSKRTLELLLRRTRKGDPFLTELLERRRVEKLLGTYVNPLATRPHTDHPFIGTRVFPTFHMHKTLTGRLAASGPNIQNQPKYKPLRRAYIARGEGRVVCQSDYGQAELRVMAVLGKDEFLTHFFRSSHEHNKNLADGEKKMDLFDALMPSVFADIDFDAHPEMKAEKRRQLKACVPLDTEILTRRGWLKHNEVREGDETPAFDGAGRTVWSKITHVHHLGTQDVYRYGHSRWNFRVTSDHRWLTGKQSKSPNGYKDHRMQETQQIGREQAVYVAGRLDDDQPQLLTDDEVRIISWVQSDGYLKISEAGTGTAQGSNGSKRLVIMQIMQAKPAYVDEIRSLMVGVPHSEAVRPGVNHKEAITWRISSPWARDLMIRAGLMGGGIEDFILRLPARQREIWLDTFWKAEGHYNGKNRIITQKRGEKADAFSLCAALCGYHPRVHNHSDGVVRIHLGENDHVVTNTMTMEPEGSEEVWCVTTEHGTWTARQGDRIAVTGNCVYGLSFGRGARDISEDINCSPMYAQKIISDYLATVPGVTAWRKEVLDNVRYNVPLVSRFGRYLLYEDVNDKNQADIERRALSFLPQSSASDCCLLAAIRLGEFIQENELDWEMPALIHDAIILDVPRDEVEYAMKVTGDYMVESAATHFPEVPFSVDSDFGLSWADL